MKCFIILIFFLIYTPLSENIPVSDESIESSLTFAWTAPLHLQVRNNHGEMDEIQLRPANSIGSFPVDCLFDGYLLNDEEGSVAVSGCQNSTEVTIVIMSRYSRGSMFIFTPENNATQEVRFPPSVFADYGIQELDEDSYTDNKMRSKRSFHPIDEIEIYDEMGFGASDMPEALVFNFRIAYEDSFLTNMNGSCRDAEKYINDVTHLSKPYFTTYNLGVKIYLNVTKEIEYLQNKKFKIGAYDLKSTKAIKSAEPLSIYVFDNDRDINQGISFRKGACNHFGRLLNKWRSDKTKAVITNVHELGHWFAMYHDYQEDNYNKINIANANINQITSYSRCNNTGVMTNIPVPPEKWSKCSQGRFEYFYGRNKDSCKFLNQAPTCNNDDGFQDAPCSCGTNLCSSQNKEYCNHETATCIDFFFAEINLPYSIKRGEIVSLNISVFNKFQSQLPVHLQINANADNIKYESNHEEVCVEARDSVVVPFKIEALRLGNHNITASASITRGIPGCNNVAEGEGFTDALIRPLLVKPEGIPEEKVRTKLKCSATRNTNKFTMPVMHLPKNRVKGSVRGWIQITSDVMAPALQNIEKLVNLPTGCGEQNMIGLVPNIYLLQYLDATNKREPELVEKAKTFMKIGYNRQQTYRHDDGSFSIWGTSKHNAHFRRGVDEGSTWLTAFVVKSFSMSANYIDVDIKLLQQSVDWLMGGQMENGCFSKSGYVHHKELVGGSSNASLTPFVFTALLEARSRLEVDLDEARLMKAMDCMLDNVNTSDAYTSVITAYAANRLVELETQFNISEQLKERIFLLWPHVLDMNPSTATNSTPASIFKQSMYTPKTDAVEMTAYNLMTLLIQKKIPEASKVVKWMTKQRNSQGGFISTQDTVVALQALSLYALKVPSNNLDMRVKITEKKPKSSKKQRRSNQKSIETFFNLNQDNAQLLQTKRVAFLPNEAAIEIKGDGCVMVQTVLRYNVQEKRRNRGFDLAVFNQNDERIRVCAKYTGSKEQTNMVVAEVEMATGWELYRESVEELLNDVESRVRKYEMQEKENKVVLYFDDIPKEEHCIEMEVKLVTIIEEPKHAIAIIYDYYDAEETKSITYLM